MPKRIAEVFGTETLIPVSILSFVCGGVFWLSVMYADLSHANAQIISMKQEMQAGRDIRRTHSSRMWENQRAIDRRLSTIEGKLDFLIKRMKL